MSKYIFVVGGVMSGVGKGVTAASLGTILEARGFKVNPLKIDPYLNVDAGTMNPIEHGEVFVLDSGLETDQDMGNYERFLGRSLPAENYMTSGMVYQYVINKERALGYGGKCVDPVPAISEEILRRLKVAETVAKPDITVIEIGGTVGEYQNAIFIEAARILKLKHPADVLFVLVSYLPVPGKLGEMKTKPTQYAVRTMNSYGVHPDIIIARSDRPLDQARKDKIALASNVTPESIISAPDVASIYDIPVNFEKDELSAILLKRLKLRAKKEDLSAWKKMAARAASAKTKAAPLKIAIVGKYFRTGEFVLADAYISVIEALRHGAAALGRSLKLDWLDAETYEQNGAGREKLKELKNYNGVLIPGGFGARGVEGKIKAIQFARGNKLPFLGLCYGLQLAVVEYARHMAGLPGAHTSEVKPEAADPVIAILEGQKGNLAAGHYGASMRLGAYPAWLKQGSLAAKSYGTQQISERHRHRYEVNPKYVEKLTQAGLVFSGASPDGKLMEIIELPKTVHPFFLATQFHPEFKSRPLAPHPLFLEFLKAAAKTAPAS
jgi:CTP synthase